MKRLTKPFIAAFLTAVLLLAGLPAGSRQAEAAVPNQVLINVTAAQIKKSGASAAIQTALDKARSKATATKPYVIRVAPGSYGLKNTLALYSNTTLDLTGVTLKKTRQMQILRTGRFTETDHTLTKNGVTGYYYKNITVCGGILDAAKYASAIFSGGHAQNVTFENVTFQNTYNTHMVEVGGINGYTMRGCVFKKQTASAAKLKTEADEAVQLDVLEDFHLGGFRPEDLAMKNVLFENCIFQNFLRGIGSHTAILNNNLNKITIRNCYFQKGKSAAITAYAWDHAVIENNIIKDVPRGIAVVAVAEEGRGTYPCTTLAKQGNTKAKFSVKYNADTSPARDMTIQNNYISISDAEDPMGIQSAGINIFGQKITSSPRLTSLDDSGGLPKGNYYYADVTVQNNFVTGLTQGIKLGRVNTGLVKDNVIKGRWDNDDSVNHHGIVVADGASKIQIASNRIDNIDMYGVQITDSSVSKVIDNIIRKPGRYGITGVNSKVTHVCRNTVTSPKSEGINLNTCSAVTQVAKNYVTDPGDYGIDLFGTTAETVSANTVREGGLGAIYIRMDSNVEQVTDNMVDGSADVDMIILYDSHVDSFTGNHIYGGRCGIRLKTNGGSVSAGKIRDNHSYNSTYGVWLSAGNAGTVRGNYAVGAASVLKINGTGSVDYEADNYDGDEIEGYTPTHIIRTGITAPTCTASGSTGDLRDLVTGKITGSGSVVDRLYHSETFVSIKHPTTAAEGKDQAICIRCGKAHNIVTEKALLASPAIRSASVSSGKATIKWTHVPGATKYRLYRSVNGGSYKAIKTTTGISFTDKVTAGKTYKYVVKAYDGTVWSVKSSAKKVTP